MLFFLQDGHSTSLECDSVPSGSIFIIYHHFRLDISPSFHSPLHLTHLKAATSILLIQKGHLGSSHSLSEHISLNRYSWLAGMYLAIATIFIS